uniref:Uncharacterized protein n=1 Tax=Solanum tuberosum TaxID=4113 RepID=M1A4I4_SOLTU
MILHAWVIEKEMNSMKNHRNDFEKQVIRSRKNMEGTLLYIHFLQQQTDKQHVVPQVRSGEGRM